MSRPIPDNVCFIDLETLPIAATVGMDLTRAPGWSAPDLEVAEVKARAEPKSYTGAKLEEWRKVEAARFATASEAAQAAAQGAVFNAQAKALSAWRKGSLSPYRGRIACIGVAWGEHPPEVIDCVEDEEAGLRALNAWVYRALTWARFKGRDHTAKTIFIAHNGDGFDFPFIQLRALRHGSAKLARRFHQEKPWDGVLVDTAGWWPKTGGWSGKRLGTKLDDICAHLGIERPDNPISGAEVLDAYVGGRWADVVAHARADVRDLREVYRVLLEVRGG